MIVFPNAKINVGLNITEKREDGYHNIETIFYPVRIYDALEFVASEPDEVDKIVTTGINEGLEDSEQNLVIKAVKKLRAVRHFPNLKIHLHKAIPSGAGLGGGSSDASCMLKSANRFFNLGISRDELMKLSTEIGSDCPFFIDNTPAYATGRGEILRPVDSFLEGFFVVLLNPRLHVSTREAYANCKPQLPRERLVEMVSKPVDEWKDFIKNDFEDYAFGKYPLIGDLKEDLYKFGALFSLMSGSGSSVFGIFRNKPQLPERLNQYLIFEGLA